MTNDHHHQMKRVRKADLQQLTAQAEVAKAVKEICHSNVGDF